MSYTCNSLYGFIGVNLCEYTLWRFCTVQEEEIVIIDDYEQYYDVREKRSLDLTFQIANEV